MYYWLAAWVFFFQFVFSSCWQAFAYGIVIGVASARCVQRSFSYNIVCVYNVDVLFYFFSIRIIAIVSVCRFSFCPSGQPARFTHIRSLHPIPWPFPFSFGSLLRARACLCVCARMYGVLAFRKINVKNEQHIKHHVEAVKWRKTEHHSDDRTANRINQANNWNGIAQTSKKKPRCARFCIFI